MMIGRGNRSTRRKPAPLTLCPPQTLHVFLDANPGRLCLTTSNCVAAIIQNKQNEEKQAFD
jgi:hypothetical protein